MARLGVRWTPLVMTALLSLVMREKIRRGPVGSRPGP
jgi:hypothetical protein